MSERSKRRKIVWRREERLEAAQRAEHARGRGRRCVARRARRGPVVYAVEQAVWSRDDALVVAAMSDFTLRAWDAASGALLHTMRLHTNKVHVLQCHPFDRAYAWERGARRPSDGGVGRVAGGCVRHYDGGEFETLVLDGSWSPCGSRIVVERREGGSGACSARGAEEPEPREARKQFLECELSRKGEIARDARIGFMLAADPDTPFHAQFGRNGRNRLVDSLGTPTASCTRARSRAGSSPQACRPRRAPSTSAGEEPAPPGGEAYRAAAAGAAAAAAAAAANRVTYLQDDEALEDEPENSGGEDDDDEVVLVESSDEGCSESDTRKKTWRRSTRFAAPRRIKGARTSSTSTRRRGDARRAAGARRAERASRREMAREDRVARRAARRGRSRGDELSEGGRRQRGGRDTETEEEYEDEDEEDEDEDERGRRDPRRSARGTARMETDDEDEQNEKDENETRANGDGEGLRCSFTLSGRAAAPIFAIR